MVLCNVDSHLQIYNVENGRACFLVQYVHFEIDIISRAMCLDVPCTIRCWVCVSVNASCIEDMCR
jgi:hypothetical protein